MNSFWDHEKHTIPEYQQAGDIHGKFFGNWLKQIDDLVIIISLGDQTKRYWLQINNCYYGNYKTPELAASKAADLLKSKSFNKEA